jgi:hypothetical protein
MYRPSASHRRCALILAALVATGCSQASMVGKAITSKEQMPEFFGLFALEDGTRPTEVGKQVIEDLKRLDEGEEAFWMAFRRGPTLRGPASFVLYDDNFRPQALRLIHAKPFWRGGTFGYEFELLELRIAPVEGKKSMYRLSPSAPLKPGLYVIAGHADALSGTRDYVGCLTVDAKLEDYQAIVRHARDEEREQTRQRAERLRAATVPQKILAESEWTTVWDVNQRGVLTVTDVGVRWRTSRSDDTLYYSQLKDCVAERMGIIPLYIIKIEGGGNTLAMHFVSLVVVLKACRQPGSRGRESAASFSRRGVNGS